MEVISDEDASKLDRAKVGGGKHLRISKNSAVFAMCDSLLKGQTLLLKREEWSGKTIPSTTFSHFSRVKKTRKYHVFALADKSGWIISPKK